MKNFLDYLKETQKTYEFKVKIANSDPTNQIATLKERMAAYVVESIGEIKRLPIMETQIDFPSQKNAEIFVFEVALQYPVMADQLRVLIAESLNVPAALVSVVPSSHPEELWRNKEGELREYVQGEDVLTKPLPDASPEQKAASKAYAGAETILKELNKAPKFEIAGKEKAENKTTNDLPQGKTSPVKGK